MSRKSDHWLWISIVLLLIGAGTGFVTRPFVMPFITPEVAEEEPEEEGHAHGSDKVVGLLDSTIANMNLKSGKFEVQDFVEHIQIPAEFIERLPDGRNLITAPIGGQVSKVYVAPGQSILPGQPLFELSVTDEPVSTAQVKLLGVLAQISTNEQLLDRNRRLVAKEIIAGKSVIEMELALEQLKTQRNALEQELLLRGMAPDQLRTLIQDKTLVRALTIYAPDMMNPGTTPEKNVFTVETLDAFTGKSLRRGERLCELIHHGRLMLKGMAFESDVKKISTANQNGWKFRAIVGEAEEVVYENELDLHSIDNHVDDLSQTFSVYVAIENELTGKSKDEQDREYVQWRFRSGQRAHLEVPVREWKKQVVIPIEALVREGPETFVFKKVDHSHANEDGSETFEFEKVPVKVLHTDKTHAVLEKQVRLDLFEKYALNNAYQLNLALKQAASGGGGHGHSHPHPH